MDAGDRPADEMVVTSSPAQRTAARPPARAALDGTVRRAAIGAGLLTAVLVVVLQTGVGGPLLARVLTDLITPLAAGAAAAASLRASRRHHGRHRAFWLLMAVASLLWAAAETTWAVYELGLDREVPTPSWADIGYLAAVPVAAAALLVHPASHATSTGRSRSVLDGLAVATALLLLTWSYALGPLWAVSDLSTAGGLVAVAYPFTDVVLVFLVVLVIMRSDTGDRTPLWWVLGGLVVTAGADSVYTCLAATDTYVSGQVLDVGWIGGYLGIALGGYSAQVRPEVTSPDPAVALVSPLASAVAPYVPILLALLVLPWLTTTGGGLSVTEWLLALSLVALVLVRQLLVAVDSRRDCPREVAP